MSNKGISPEKAVFGLLVTKYQVDPSWFDEHMPDVGEIIGRAVSPPQPAKPRLKLSDKERMFHSEALARIRANNEQGQTDAIMALKHCAVLTLDDWLRNGIDHETRVSLFESAFGKPPEAFKEDTTIYLNDERDTETAYQASLVRGVVLNLDADLRLVSVAVTPHKVRERERLMSIVGIGRDSKSDVAARHDEYLAEISPHGCS